MAIERSQRPGRAIAFGASLLTKALPRFSVSELYSAVNTILADTGAEVRLDESLTRVEAVPEGAGFWSRQKKEPPRVGIVVNGVVVLVQGRDRPAFAQHTSQQLNYGLWQEGRGHVIRSRAHVEILEMRPGSAAELDPDLCHDRATTVTVVAAAVAHVMDGGTVVWHSSRRVAPAEFLTTAIEELMGGQVPVDLWLGFRESVPMQGRPGFVTTSGLEALIGTEIEVHGEGLTGRAAFNVALDMAARCSRQGGLPGHGDMIVLGRSGEFHIGHRAASRAGAPPILVMSPVPHAAGPATAPGPDSFRAGAA